MYCVTMKNCAVKKHMFLEIMKCVHKFPHLKNSSMTYSPQLLTS